MERRTFDSFYDTLVKTLAPADVAAGCISKEMISDTELDEVQLLGRTRPTHETNAVLLCAVRRARISDPDTAFSAFLDVKYDQLVTKIRKFIKKETKY